MQKDNRWAVPRNPVVYLRVAALDALEGLLSHVWIKAQRRSMPKLARRAAEIQVTAVSSAYECVACGDAIGAGSSGGSSGMMIHAIGYERKPIPVMNATINQTTRTSVTSTSKYSEKPRQTPAILRPKRGRISFLRARHEPTLTPQ